MANMALGGKKQFIANKRIPKKAVRLAKKVDKLMSMYYPRIFSVDFLFKDNTEPYIVECNATPTLKRYAFGEFKRLEYFEHFCNGIKKALEG